VADLDRARLDRLIAGADELPSCPAVLARVAQVVRDPQSSARDLGNVILTDEALTSRLIRLVNSAFYGLSGTISTVTQAVVILGYQEIRSMVYAMGAETVFARSAVPGGLDLTALWDHSLQVAVLGRELAYNVRHPVPEEVFVAGVIHDIGQVLLNEMMGPAYRSFRQRCHAAGADLAAEEERELGISHAEVGRRLTGKWGFPEKLQEAVAWHHCLPEAGPGASAVASMVLAANRMVLAGAAEAGTARALAAVPAPVLAQLRLDETQVRGILARAGQEHLRIRGSFDLFNSEES
jgi:HD-like signal output (HDOD) protein